MGNASFIHPVPNQQAYPSYSTNFLKDATSLSNRLKPLFTTPNIYEPNSKNNSARKTHRTSPASRKRQTIKIDAGNLNKAILLRLIHNNSASQPEFDDCNVPVSTEGSQGITKAHRANHLLNRLDYEKFDGDKTTTNSIDTSCLKLSPKETIFHPQAGIYFNYDKTQDNELAHFDQTQHEKMKNISVNVPTYVKEDSLISLGYTKDKDSKINKFSNKENDLEHKSELENLYTKESVRQSLEITPQKQHQGEPITEDKRTRRLCLKSKSASRQKNQEITTESDSEPSCFPYKGDPILRNYGMISECTEPAKVERFLNSDSKASPLPSGRSPLPSGRLSSDKVEENEERQSSRRNSTSKPLPKHRLLLQANKLKRERSCENLSSSRARSVGTRDSTCQDRPTAATTSHTTSRTEFPLPLYSSPEKPDLSSLVQYQQQQQSQKLPLRGEQYQQVETKWENFYTATTQMKKEMSEFKKDSGWTEEQKEVSRPLSQRQTIIEFSQEVSPMNTKDQQAAHFTHATLSLSPYSNLENNRRFSIENAQNLDDKIQGFVKERPSFPLKTNYDYLSPQKPGNNLSPLKEESHSKQEDKVNIATNNHHESFNTQNFGTGLIDFQGLQLRNNTMDSFDPPSSCYESNLTSQLERERDICVVDLLAKDNNSEYNREHYQSALSDINQKIDGILKKCCLITERSNKSLVHPTPASNSPNPTFIAVPGEMILDDPALTNMSQSKANIVVNISEKRDHEESSRTNQPKEIEDILGYPDVVSKKPDIQDFFTLKDDLTVKQVLQPHSIEDTQQENLKVENENKDFEQQDNLKEAEENKEGKNDLVPNYESAKNVLSEVVEEPEEYAKDEVYLKYLRELKVHDEEQKIHQSHKIKTDEIFVMKNLPENEKPTEEKDNVLCNQYVTDQDGVQEQNPDNETFTLESENESDSICHLYTTNNNQNQEKVPVEKPEPNQLKNSLIQEITSHSARDEASIDIHINENITKSPVKKMSDIITKSSPQRSSPGNLERHTLSVEEREDLILNQNIYPNLEIQRAAEELESLSKALENLPQHPENFVSTTGLDSVKKVIMEQIEGIHTDILERIGQLNKKLESKSPLVNKRRDSVVSQEPTQDTRNLDFSSEMNPKRMMFSVNANRTAYTSQTKTESLPQSYCPSPFQSQVRDHSQAFEPALTFGQGHDERAALMRLRKGQQKERQSKFEPKQVSLSIAGLVDASTDISGCTSANNKSMMNSKIERGDKHQHSIRQIIDQSIASKPASPLSYRSTLLKNSARDSVLKANRTGKSIERDVELEATLSGTLKRDSSNEKEGRKSVRSQQSSYRGLLSGQQTGQQQLSNEKEIREAFNSRQPNSPLYMSHVLGTDSVSQKSRRGSYSEVKNMTTVNRSDEIWVQEEIDKKKRLAVELMNLSSLRKSRELEMPDDCVRKMEDWTRSENSSWSQIPTVRDRKSSSHGVLKIQDYLAGENKGGPRELNEYPLSILLARENQESVDTIFEEELDSKNTTTREQGVQTVNRMLEHLYFKQMRETKENGRGGMSLQNSFIEQSRNISSVPNTAKGNRSQVSHESVPGAKTPERRTMSKNIYIKDMELLSTKRMNDESDARSASRLKKREVSKGFEKQTSASKAQRSAEKAKYNKCSTDRSLKGLPQVSKSVRDNAVAMSELMQAYVLEQKERSYK